MLLEISKFFFDKEIEKGTKKCCATRMIYETAMNHLEENRIIYSCKKIKEKEKIDLTSKYQKMLMKYTCTF